MPGENWADIRKGKTMADLTNVPPDVLQEYLDGSPQQADESDDHWRDRNVLAELKLEALYPPPAPPEPR
jgi:hypothetical protein